jgi:RNA polymerase sigma-70 factor (ECF subfamily)
MAITHSRSIDSLRRFARVSAREVAVDEYPETSGPVPANMADEEYGDAEALQQALAGLPEGQRVAIELVKLREMSLKEASTASGMTIGALKVATHRATRALRLLLQAREEHGH